MKINNTNDIKNHPTYSLFLSNLLIKLKNSDIKPLTDQEPEMLKIIATKVFAEIGSDSIPSEWIKPLCTDLFFEWRGNKEVGLSILCNLPRNKTSGSYDVTISTDVRYGFGCTKYSDYAKKLAKAKTQQKKEALAA